MTHDPTPHDVLPAAPEDAVSGSRTGRYQVAIPAASAPSSPELRQLLGLAIAVVVVGTLYVAQEVLIPITLAVLLSFVLSPLVNLLERFGLWRAPSVMFSVLGALGGIALVATLIGTQASALAPQAPEYARTIERKIGGVQAFAASHLAFITRQFGGAGVEPAPSPEPAGPSADGTGTARGVPPPKPVLVEVARPGTSPLAVARTILRPVVGPLETMVIVLVVSIFILLEKEDLRDRFIRLIGAADLHRTTVAMDDAGERLSRYFVSQLTVNTAFGLVIGLGLWAIGVPSPAVWGVLAGILRFVPYIGPIIAAVAPIALATAVDPGWSTAIHVTILFVVVEPLTGYVIEPLVYGHSTGLAPVSVIVAAIFWTAMWGPIGLILSTPLTLFLVVVGRHVRSLEFFDVLLGDRPALSPVDRFYQRMLSKDPDDVLDQAEALLAERPLLDVYDDVVLNALREAAKEEGRGGIAPGLASEMSRGMLAVVRDLGEHAGTTQAATVERTRPRRPGTVACIAGRGPFDDVVAAMLAQLLEQKGVGTRLVPHASVAREAIAALDLSGVTVVAVSYLQLTGTPGHLRHLVARLRACAPNAGIVIGLWTAGESILSEAAVQQSVGADSYAGTLRSAVDAVLAAHAKSLDPTH